MPAQRTGMINPTFAVQSNGVVETVDFWQSILHPAARRRKGIAEILLGVYPGNAMMGITNVLITQQVLINTLSAVTATP